jgi:hypothetical protein
MNLSKLSQLSLSASYKSTIILEVCDGDEDAKFVFWDSSLDELIGMPASELLKKQHEVSTQHI